ncbi:pmpB [Symbiodinium sp. CCMP2592]|nr:pmpB [Symbiodinium sp. CCMP2592]
MAHVFGLGQLLTAGAMRPSLEHVQQLDATEGVLPLESGQSRRRAVVQAADAMQAAVGEATSVATAEKATFKLQVLSFEDEEPTLPLQPPKAADQVRYPPCNGLPHSGSHVLHAMPNFRTSCIWHGEGLKVTLKEPLIFEGSLVLAGELQIEGVGEMDGPCITVLGNMSVIAARASFVGCINKKNSGQKVGNGGALHVQENFITDSDLTFESCYARFQGGGLYTKSFIQRSRISLERYALNLSGSTRAWDRPNSSVQFRNCSSQDGGGLFAEHFVQEAKASVENCHSVLGGGGAHVEDRFSQGPNCTARFRGCRAATSAWGGGSGGCLLTTSFIQESHSSLLFENCTADLGGCMALGKFGRVPADAEIRFSQGAGSSARFQSCTAKKGGGLYGLDDASFTQEAHSTVLFENCEATEDGGGAYLQHFMQGPKSSAEFRSCVAGRGGGGLHIKTNGSFSQSRSKALFEKCEANATGGGVLTTNFIQRNASAAIFENCTASKGGGGVHVRGSVSQVFHSSATFRGCVVREGSGGGLLAEDFTQESSLVLFDSCEATFDGGGAHVQRFRQGPNSSAAFRSCRVGEKGGGLAVRQYLQGAGSSAAFENCTTGLGHGGGLHTSNLDGNGSLHFKMCRARVGGGLHVPQDGKVLHGGSLTFEACSAGNTGGGLFLKAGQGHFGKLSFERCDAAVLAAAFAAIPDNGTEADVRIQELTLSNGGARSVRDFDVAGALTLESTNLSQHPDSLFGAYISAENLVLEDEVDCTRTTTCTFSASSARSAGFRCPLGTGVVDFKTWADFGCQACKPGDTQVLNWTTRSCSPCPDGARKCLAGALKMEPGLMVELENVSRSLHCPNEASCTGGELSNGGAKVAMCKDGYGGQGCAHCSDGYAMADSSVLACTACGEGLGQQVLQWLVFLSQRSVLFGLAAMSALGAKKAGDLKHSSIYLNQLMAFATISNTILAAVLQTQTAKDIKDEAVELLFAATATATQTASGQGSLPSASSQCLLSYIGCEKTLWGSHLLDVVVAAVLIALLSLVKDFRAALIAGLNCFMPTIAADFGKYLVCYRLQPDDVSELGGLRCPFLPGAFPGLPAVMQVVGGLIVFMAAALCTWLSLSRSSEDPLPSHVVFLTSKYRPEFALFETERLIRLANELHWGHSVRTQQMIIITTAVIAALASLWIAGRAVRPAREDVQQLLETEVAPADVPPVGEASMSRDPEPGMREAAPLEAGAVFLEGESADYPHCEGLPRNGSHVIETALVLSSSCTWHGHPGLQVTLKEPLTFQGNLVLMGEIQIMGKQELDGPCINVGGNMTVIAAKASFVGCRNKMQAGFGGALFIEKEFITRNSDVEFESCSANKGGGLYAKGYQQEAGSSVLFERCSGTGSSTLAVQDVDKRS